MAQAVCNGGRRILVIDFVWRVESVATKVIVTGRLQREGCAIEDVGFRAGTSGVA
jgi:hypothetical protein